MSQKSGRTEHNSLRQAAVRRERVGVCDALSKVKRPSPEFDAASNTVASGHRPTCELGPAGVANQTASNSLRSHRFENLCHPDVCWTTSATARAHQRSLAAVSFALNPGPSHADHGERQDQAADSLRDKLTGEDEHDDRDEERAP